MQVFEAAFAAGTAQIMPYYGRPVGTELEEVGFGFNRDVDRRAAARRATASTASSAPTGGS